MKEYWKMFNITLYLLIMARLLWVEYNDNYLALEFIGTLFLLITEGSKKMLNLINNEFIFRFLVIFRMHYHLYPTK